jgi:hypothetical protein
VELGTQNARRLQEIEQRRMVEEAVEKAVAAGGGFAPSQRNRLVHDELAWHPAEWWLNDLSREQEWERERSRPWEREVEIGFYRERRRSSLGGRGIGLARGFAERLAEVELEVERQYEREREREREGGRERGRRERRGRGEREKERDMFWPAEGRSVGKVGRRFGLDRSSGY